MSSGAKAGQQWWNNHHGSLQPRKACSDPLCTQGMIWSTHKAPALHCTSLHCYKKSMGEWVPF